MPVSRKSRSLYPSEYRFMLDTWYPALRHSDYRITYKVKPFDVAEAKEIIKTKPQQAQSGGNVPGGSDL